MFRSAATKIAHNSTLPALAGNRDLKPLQELITSEKAVLQSLQRLSNDLIKSSECLRHWGAGEGDDLQDTLAVSTTLIGYVSSSLSQLAVHEQTIREHMKSVRTREENLDDLRRRRKSVAAKADAAEKRLNKMGSEHKSLQQQTELLNNLREQIRNMDWEILNDEAKLGDFKRTSSKNWMMLKFGGLLECAEKATIVGELGKLVIEEIPLNITQPGQPREVYAGFEKTEKLATEAQRCIAEVVFDPQPVTSTNVPVSPTQAVNSNSFDGLPSGSRRDSIAYLQDTNEGPGMGLGTDEFGGLSDRQGPRGYGTMPAPMSGGPMRIGDDGSRLGSTISGSGSNFTSNAGSSFAPPTSPPPSRFGGQFTTFPTRKVSLPGGRVNPPEFVPPPTEQALSFKPVDEGSPGFAADVADALAYVERDETSTAPGRTSQEAPAPSYEAPAWGSPLASNGLPRGAAAPLERNPWESPLGSSSLQNEIASNGAPPPALAHISEQDGHADSDDETQLPYASPPPAAPSLPQPADEHGVRHTRFAEESDSDANGYAPEEPSSANEEQVPSVEPSDDEHALNAAAAREVARELDALSFNPPPGPPPGHPGNRTPSPLLPPIQPFAQQQVPPPAYGSSLSPRSEAMYNGSRPDLRGSTPNLNIDMPSPRSSPSTNYSPSAQNTVYQNRPSLSSNLHASSPTLSYSSPSASTYGTPPEMPAAQPLRTGSPVLLTPGSRTISAAAFKRPQMRSPSGSGPNADTRPLPDVSPLALRKKSGSGPGLPGSPYPQTRDGPPGRRSNDSASRPEQEHDDSYEFISSYGEPQGPVGGNGDGTSGYGSGKFATNLEGDGLR